MNLIARKINLINKENTVCYYSMIIFHLNMNFTTITTISSWDGCSDDYSITYEDGSEVEEDIEQEIMNIIEEEGVYDLEDNHQFEMTDTAYEIDGDLDIQKIN